MSNFDLAPAHASSNHKSIAPGYAAKRGLEISRILVPTDLKKESQSALPYAISLARVFGAKLTLLHVYQEPYSIDYLRGPQACGAVIRHRRGVEDALVALAAEVRENQVACNADFRCGSLSGEIAKAAENCDLMVISTHQYGWLGRLAYGSDADSILHHTHCPVLILHQDKGVTWPASDMHFPGLMSSRRFLRE
jgi:nucleotide-binding universal stress UspA family protein